MRLAFFLIFSFLFSAACHANVSVKTNINHKQKAIFYTDTGEYTVALEVAKTEAQKTKGLMFRTVLPQDTGMVFVYDTPTMTGIWMKNTKIPLDVIFIDCDNKIVECVPREPNTLDISVPIKKICTIIEVNTRFCLKNSIKVNDKVVFIPPIHIQK